jgi:hypothetical protein
MEYGGREGGKAHVRGALLYACPISLATRRPASVFAPGFPRGFYRESHRANNPGAARLLNFPGALECSHDNEN